MKHRYLEPHEAKVFPVREGLTANDGYLDGIDSLSLIAHQMLTPLSVIDGAAQRLIRTEGKTSVEVAERGRRIRAAAQELVTLAHGLLDQVRSSLEPSARVWIPYSLNEVVHRAANRIRALQPERVVRIDIPQAAGQLHGRPELLTQMIAILLDNAAKYSESDKPIDVSAVREAGKVVVTVRDEGMGIQEADLEKLFQPFYRARNAASRAGIGLGLSLAQRIAHCQGGEITVRSEVGRGSTFSIILPQP
jgi:two-component system, OmpR family, sensor histidine kinase SenX3